MEKVFLGVLAGPAEPGLICVVRATLDFIYYAHFESHTLDSLRQLNTAWITFHNNLQYFVDQNVRKDRTDFNIPKLHSMHHYIESIISLGSADGYSTESPERLHIDFAKAAYRSTNKKQYVKQMTKWLERQDSCFRFASYLRWTVPGYLSELNSMVDEARMSDDEEEDSEAQDNDGEQVESLGFSVAKQPAHPGVSISSLIANYGTINIIPCLTQYLRSSPHSSRSARVPTIASTLPVYKCLTVRLPPAPQVTTSITKDIICARPAMPAQGLTPAIPSQFDTVLVREESDSENSSVGHTALEGEYIFSKFRVHDIFLHSIRLDCCSSASDLLPPRGVWLIPRTSHICGMVHALWQSGP